MIKQLANTISRRGLWLIVITGVVVGAIASQAQLLSANEGSAPSHPLEGTDWVLASVGGKEELAGTEITALFDGERVAGSAGCNGYFAGYESDADGLAISAVGMTMMMCHDPDGIMEQEMAFATALGSVNAYHISGDTLEISTDGGSLIFTPK